MNINTIKKSKWLWLLLPVLLTSCSAPEEEAVDTSINISLPYTTVMPTAAIEDASAIVITELGTVYLTDASALESDVEANGLSIGSSGDEVLELEKRLYQLNYTDEKPDGVFDEDTAQAVARFARTIVNGELRIATSDLIEALSKEGAPVYGTEEYYAAVKSSYATLQKGDKGSAVKEMRERLEQLGYPVTGDGDVYDDDTAYAVRLFYRAYGQDELQAATVAMQQMLYSDNAMTYEEMKQAVAPVDDGLTLSSGSIGTRVEALQRQLILLGFPDIECDGKYGTEEMLAVVRIENALGLGTTGCVTERLWNVIMSAAMPEYSVLCGIGEREKQDYVVLTETDYGIDVQHLQMRLIELGYMTGTPSARYDDKMKRAIECFRNKNALTGTGMLDEQEVALLYADFVPAFDGETAMDRCAPDGPLVPGDSNDAVLLLNRKLIVMGYLSGVPTDEYTEETKQAVVALQSALHAEETGCVTLAMYRFIASTAVPACGSVVSAGNDGAPYADMTGSSKGYSVLVLQRGLIRRGLIGYSDADSTYNDATRESVRQIQAEYGYADPDGLADACLVGLITGE